MKNTGIDRDEKNTCSEVRKNMEKYGQRIRMIVPQAQFQSVPELGRSSQDAVRLECAGSVP